ncbi:MAG: hypothetical protein ACM3YE_09095 [Bacteroidota bacterium]
MINISFWYILAAPLVIGLIVYFINFWLAKRQGATLSHSFWISLLVMVLVAGGLLFFLQEKNEYEHSLNIAELNQKHQEELEKVVKDYQKEMAYLEWRNKVFPTSAQMEKELVENTQKYKLSKAEVANWRDAAHDNTLEKLMPKRDMQDVMKEYQTRLKASLAQVKSGETLLSSDIRVLAENINTIRVIGKEYEKVLFSFRELYNNITANPGKQLEAPKQKYFLFFPIKRKEYNALLQEYYQAQGNSEATANVAAKLKVTIEKAEAEFKEINRRFEENLGFLESTSTSITYNSEKLEQLIEAAIQETEIINMSEPSTRVKVNKKPTN